MIKNFFEDSRRYEARTRWKASKDMLFSDSLCWSVGMPYTTSLPAAPGRVWDSGHTSEPPRECLGTPRRWPVSWSGGRATRGARERERG